MTDAKPLRIYTDENVRRRLVDMLRDRGFDIQTAVEAQLLGTDDQAQLAHAAASGRVLLTFDRRDFRRLHAQYISADRQHVGIALLPSEGSLERLTARAVLMLLSLQSGAVVSTVLLNWNDVQVKLHRGERPAGSDDADVRIALGLS